VGDVVDHIVDGRSESAEGTDGVIEGGGGRDRIVPSSSTPMKYVAVWEGDSDTRNASWDLSCSVLFIEVGLIDRLYSMGPVGDSGDNFDTAMDDSAFSSSDEVAEELLVDAEDGGGGWWGGSETRDAIREV